MHTESYYSTVAGRDYLNRRRRGKQAWRARRRAVKRTEQLQLFVN